MKRYIDAEKAKKIVINSDWENKGIPLAFCQMIDLIPTADVVEVKHGKWINEPPYYALDGRYLKSQQCSFCYSVFVSDGNTPYSNHPYCCECGAKMDGGTNEKTV